MIIDTEKLKSGLVHYYTGQVKQLEEKRKHTTDPGKVNAIGLAAFKLGEELGDSLKMIEFVENLARAHNLFDAIDDPDEFIKKQKNGD